MAEGDIAVAYCADVSWYNIRQCHYCRQQNVRGYYWQKLGDAPGVNVCKPCGDPIYEMQRLNEVVNG